MNTPLITTEISKGAFQQTCLLFLPGALVTIPFIVLLYLGTTHPDGNSDTPQKCLMLINIPFFYLVGFVLSPLIGLILENLGSMLEKYLDYKNNVDEKVWESYLKFDLKDGIHSTVIFKYIDSIVFRYKMELSLVWALLIFSCEWLFIYINDDSVLQCEIFYSVMSISVLALIFTFFQANSSCKLLDKLRRILVNSKMDNPHPKTDQES